MKLRHVIGPVIYGFVNAALCVVLTYAIDFGFKANNSFSWGALSFVTVSVGIVGSYINQQVLRGIGLLGRILSFIASIVIFIIGIIPSAYVISSIVSKYVTLDSEDYGAGILFILVIASYLAGLTIAFVGSVILGLKDKSGLKNV